MILLLIVALWLLLLATVGGLCRTAQAGDEALAAGRRANRGRRRGSRSVDAHPAFCGADPSTACVGGRAPNLFVGSGETKNFSAAA